MNNLPLQPLRWRETSVSASARTPMHSYEVIATENNKFYVKKVRLETQKLEEVTGFDTAQAAKDWCFNEHYAVKMQPYVKPMPTWIGVNERLPESECFYLVQLFDGHRDEHVFVILWWNSEHQQFLEWDAMCEPTHWMPIPEFSTMKNLHKGE